MLCTTLSTIFIHYVLETWSGCDEMLKEFRSKGLGKTNNPSDNGAGGDASSRENERPLRKDEERTKEKEFGRASEICDTTNPEHMETTINISMVGDIVNLELEQGEIDALQIKKFTQLV